MRDGESAAGAAGESRTFRSIILFDEKRDIGTAERALTRPAREQRGEEPRGGLHRHRRVQRVDDVRVHQPRDPEEEEVGARHRVDVHKVGARPQPPQHGARRVEHVEEGAEQLGPRRRCPRPPSAGPSPPPSWRRRSPPRPSPPSRAPPAPPSSRSPRPPPARAARAPARRRCRRSRPAPSAAASAGPPRRRRPCAAARQHCAAPARGEPRRRGAASSASEAEPQRRGRAGGCSVTIIVRAWGGLAARQRSRRRCNCRQRRGAKRGRRVAAARYENAAQFHEGDTRLRPRRRPRDRGWRGMALLLGVIQRADENAPAGHTYVDHQGLCTDLRHLLVVVA